MEKQFKHIKLNTAEEEVIRIGGEDTAPKSPTTSDFGEGEGGDLQAVSPPKEPRECVDAAKAGDEYFARSANYTSPSPSQAGGTSLEDLESSRMSFTQKVVIVVAVLALIAFAVWFFGFGGKI